MFLCDWAEEIQGKLYIMGAGWTRISVAPNSPATMAIAAHVSVSWDETNQPYNVHVRLVTADGNPIIAPNGKPVQVDAKLEVGRPPGMRKGTSVGAPMALKFEGLPLAPGEYEWRFEVGDNALARAPFTVVPQGG